MSQMNELVRIDDEVITQRDLILNLKLSNQFPKLLEALVRDKVTVHAAKKRNMEPSQEELQKAADSFRLSLGLHRAQDTHLWMEQMGVSVDEFEKFVHEQLLKDKMIQVLASDEMIDEYFKLNSPKFDSVDFYHITTDSEDSAKEILALLEDEPESIAEIAEELNTDENDHRGCNKINTVQRDELKEEISAKLFSAGNGELIGPFKMKGAQRYEVIMVAGVNTAQLNDGVRSQITDTLYENWLQSRFEEHKVALP